MTIIKVTCPSCGDVELGPEALQLVVNRCRERSYYAFTCNDCGEQTRKPAGDDVVAALTRGGIVPEMVDTPAEAFEMHDGAPLTADDLLDFMCWLDGAMGIAEAAAAGLYGRPL